MFLIWQLIDVYICRRCHEVSRHIGHASQWQNGFCRICHAKRPNEMWHFSCVSCQLFRTMRVVFVVIRYTRFIDRVIGFTSESDRSLNVVDSFSIFTSLFNVTRSYTSYLILGVIIVTSDVGNGGVENVYLI